MAQLFTTGPALLYANIGLTGPGAGWLFIGTARTKPRISVRRGIKPIHNDIGAEKPIDLLYGGQEAIITADVNRMSLIAYYAMATCAAPTTSGGAATAGLDLPGETGTLLATEGQMFQLCVMFPFAPKAAYSNAINGPLPPCYLFPLATLESPDDIDPGTQDLAIHMIWHAIRAIAPATVSGISLFNETLYSTALPAGLPAPT